METLGTPMKEKFLLRPEAVYLNHGSFGAVPKTAFETRIRLLGELERDPDQWYIFKVPNYWKSSKQHFCEFFKVQHPDSLVFIPNATTGINTILKCLQYEKGAGILATSETFYAVKKTIKFIEETQGIIGEFIDIKLPIISRADIIDLYRQYLEKNSNIKIAIVDMITSPGSILMPYEEIIKLCRMYGVLTLVDGAHAPGQIPLNLDELGADFFVGNLHKWLFAPRGCAVLYVATNHLTAIHPLPTCQLQGQGLGVELKNDPTQDHTPYFTAVTSLQFFENLGGLTTIGKYNTELARRGRHHLLTSWHAQKQDIPEDMEAPFLLCIKMPRIRNYQNSKTGCRKLMKDLLETFDIMSLFTHYRGDIHCRISCQLYNTFHDFIVLAEAVNFLTK